MATHDLTRQWRYKPRYALAYIHGPILEYTVQVHSNLTILPFHQAEENLRAPYDWHKAQMQGSPQPGQLVSPFAPFSDPTAIVSLKHKGMIQTSGESVKQEDTKSEQLYFQMQAEVWLLTLLMGISSRRPIRKLLVTRGASETGIPLEGESATQYPDWFGFKSPKAFEYRWTKSDRDQLLALVGGYQALSDKLKKALALPLERTNRAMDPMGGSIETRALDIGLALESLLSKYTERAYGGLLALRGAWLLGKDATERARIRALISRLYDLRNGAVHAYKVIKKIDEAKVLIQSGCTTLSDLIEDRVNRGKNPDWDKLVLGGED